MDDRAIRADERRMAEHPFLSLVVPALSGTAFALVTSALTDGEESVWSVVFRVVIAAAGAVFLARWKVERNEGVRLLTGDAPPSLGEAWRATWRRVLLHTLALSFGASAYFALGNGLGIDTLFIGAAIFFVPIFLCVIIMDVGGALSGDGQRLRRNSERA